MNLFPDDKVAGIFRGFSEGGLEFHADLVLPYKSEFQVSPMHGQFLIVQLEHEEEAVLGRITSISSARCETASLQKELCVCESRFWKNELSEAALQ